MDFQSSIIEIISSIKQREFLNEAEVTNGIILRILNELNWNVYDTKKVKPQYRIDNRMIDFALCFPDNKPIIIIEVKGLGKAVNSDEQVLTYSFKCGIPIAILTDGQEWHFYLPAERGSLTERRFYKLDLLEREPEEIVKIFQGYLQYDSIKNGDAIKKAKSDYDKQYKNKEINISIPKAWEKLLQDKNKTLVTLISEKVADLCGYEPTEETVLKFLTNIGQGEQVIIEDYKETNNNYELPVIAKTKASHHGFRGVIFNNETLEARNSIGTLEALLKLSITKFPNSLIKIETQTKGRSRSLISKQKSNLYIDRLDLINDFSKQLPNNWWYGTNYSKREIAKFCKIVVESINREYGKTNITWSI